MVTEKVESVKAKDTIVSKSFLKGLEKTADASSGG